MEHNPPIILSGIEARKSLTPLLQSRVLAFGKVIHLVIISIGEDPASQVYIKNKQKYGESLGMKVTVMSLPAETQEKEIITLVETLNSDRGVHGIIVQSPVPSHCSFAAIAAYVSREKDVDGLAPGSSFVPATARGIEILLKYYQIPLSGKHVVVIGRSTLVGLPTADMALRNDATVTVCHSKTDNLPRFTRQADILIVAIGKPKFITKEYISRGQVVVDVGIHKVGETLVGDVDRKETEAEVSALTPVPGGVGPMTVYALFENVLDAAYKQSL